MGVKKITGDLDITGAYKQNGSAIGGGTKLYKHEIEFSINEDVGGSTYTQMRLTVVLYRSSAVTDTSQLAASNVNHYIVGSFGPVYNQKRFIILQTNYGSGLEVIYIPTVDIGTVLKNTINAISNLSPTITSDTVTEL